MKTNTEREWTITKEWIHQWATSGRGWTRAQLEAIGIEWPPRRGWIARVEGTVISAAARQQFERGRTDDEQPLLIEPEDLACARRIR